jgi:hypothetical protein
MLPCVDCHKGGNFTSLAAQCIACHREDALRAESIRAAHPEIIPFPSHIGFMTCSDCHNAQFFGPVAKASNRESVCR